MQFLPFQEERTFFTKFPHHPKQGHYSFWCVSDRNFHWPFVKTSSFSLSYLLSCFWERADMSYGFNLHLSVVICKSIKGLWCREINRWRQIWNPTSWAAFPSFPCPSRSEWEADWNIIPAVGCLGCHEKQLKPEWPCKHVLSLSQPTEGKKIFFIKSLPLRSQLLKMPNTLVWMTMVTQIKEL